MAALSDWDEQFEAKWLKRSIEEIIAALDKHRKNVNISRVTGSSVAIATGGTAAGLAIAAPFTLGVTLIPAIVLGIIASVGAGVSVGASVTEYFLRKHNVKEVQTKWDEFRREYIVRHNLDEEQLLNESENESTQGNLGSCVNTTVRGAATGNLNSFVNTTVRGAGTIASAAVRGAKSAATAVRVVSPLLATVSILALPLDLADLITAAHSLHRGERSPASESLERIITFLDKVIKGELQ
ncbi:uncharacterized protein LOC112553635 [Pomacea canaliculata]|uniref:uncharacterized protein LOC112553635 n=1 Tax=Pomacea canaliculata TaxID=400727 RepID=UPI000D727CEA|nr:uncharacterized protein LOC112553635 [Pomacea canaliculata]XP_025076777.1 uncharacterized protein LOC112553635 [Pomacea canaliculata]